MPSKTKTQTTSLAERTEERLKQENAWQQYSAEVEFNSDISESLETIAKTMFPQNINYQEAYIQAIINSLIQTLSPETGIMKFWEEMKNAKCKKLKVEDGHLNFYDSKNNKIDITPFTEPIIFEAHTDLYKERIMEREEKILDAKRQLEELLADISKNRKR